MMYGVKLEVMWNKYKIVRSNNNSHFVSEIAMMSPDYDNVIRTKCHSLEWLRFYERCQFDYLKDNVMD